MKSCQSYWKEYYIGVFLFLTITISSDGRPQYQRPYNTFNITLAPYPAPQYQYYNQPYHQQYQNTRSSRNISNFNNHQPVLDPTIPEHEVNTRVTYNQPVVDTTVPQAPGGYHQQSAVFNGFIQKPRAKEGDTIKSNVKEGNLQRDVRNSTKIVTHLPAGGPAAIAKEKTRILTHHVNPSRGSLSEDLRGSTQDIIFPDSFENLFDPITRLEAMPQCAEGGLYCEDIPTYPYHQIRDTLRRTTVNNDLFYDDEVDAPKEIANRISGPEEKFICKSIERTIYPKVGMTKNNKWKYIINQNQEGYIQGVRVETCLFPDNECDLSQHMPLGVVTSCKQKYVTRRMMSLADDGVPLPDIFLMPSACCCSYRMVNPLLRARNVDTTPVAP